MKKPNRVFHITQNCPTTERKKRTRLDVLCEQVLDSAIVGGIAGISAYVSAGTDASWKTFIIAFGLTFLVKLKEYRGIE